RTFTIQQIHGIAPMRLLVLIAARRHSRSFGHWSDGRFLRSYILSPCQAYPSRWFPPVTPTQPPPFINNTFSIVRKRTKAKPELPRPQKQKISTTEVQEDENFAAYQYPTGCGWGAHSLCLRILRVDTDLLFFLNQEYSFLK
ncbi:hypothetical protein HAX54_006619, partial [Datura stramonium]|nr:hypothetical protein [Datura stramonium]